MGFVVELHLMVGTTGGKYGRKVLSPGTPEKITALCVLVPPFLCQEEENTYLSQALASCLHTESIFFLHAFWHMSLNPYNNSESRDSTDFCR